MSIHEIKLKPSFILSTTYQFNDKHSLIQILKNEKMEKDEPVQGKKRLLL
jgi:hypothetical protein